MAIIDPDGYFGGDRFDDISDQARAMWPTFYLASNTVARIELNYRKVCATAFSRWNKKPTEAQFWAWVEEYQAAFLIFVYEADGSIWGQWDTSEKFLPRHKLASDMRTPSPCAREWLDWKNQYAERKSAKSNGSTNFKIMRKPAKNSAGLHTNVRGVGVGIGGGVGGGDGVGGGENQTHSADAEGVSDPAPVAVVISPKRWFESEFWPIWPARQNRDSAEKAALKIKPEDYPAILAGVKLQAERIRSMDRPIHAATWLNQRRWEDEPPPLFAVKPPGRTNFVDSVERVMRDRVERGMSPL